MAAPYVVEFEVEKDDFLAAGEGSGSVKDTLKMLGMHSAIIRRAAIITYEAEMNLVIHGGGGVLKVLITPERIEIVSKADIALLSEKFPDRRIKHYDTGRAHILASVERSLAEMGLDYLDLLLIHRPDPLMDAHETGAVLDELVTTGKVRAVGVSNFRLFDWTLLQSAMKTPLVTNQIELSLLSSEPFRNGDLAFLQERGVPPMAWSPLAGGALFDGSHPELLARLSEIGADHGTDATAIAIAWLLRHPARIIPVLGTNNLNRIRSMSDALRVTLDRETWFELYELGNGFEVP